MNDDRYPDLRRNTHQPMRLLAHQPVHSERHVNRLNQLLRDPRLANAPLGARNAATRIKNELDRSDGANCHGIGRQLTRLAGAADDAADVASDTADAADAAGSLAGDAMDLLSDLAPLLLL
jgi:hypothetical protein